MVQKMNTDYTEAVERAIQGDEEAFGYLYDVTYKNMFFIARGYLGNTQDVEDVLQDSYVKAYQALPTLKDPAGFTKWLGKIVANRCKNMLRKKSPSLFSDIKTEDGETFQYEIEDESLDYQPEQNYTQRETQELVREMIDCLSDEQRMCILMYYMDEQSVRDIAETFGISENTVKSRLNYGRKALKKKGEELQQKGYTLYGVSILPLLLYLLRQQRGSLEFAEVTRTSMAYVGQKVEAAVRNNSWQTGMQNGGNGYNNGNEYTGSNGCHEGSGYSGENGYQGGSGYSGKNGYQRGNGYTGGQPEGIKIGSGKAVGHGAAKAAGKFTAGKIIAGVAAIAVLGPLSGVLVYEAANHLQTKEVQATTAVVSATPVPSAAAVQPTDTPIPTPTPGPVQVTDADYPNLIDGDLTKEETEFVLQSLVGYMNENGWKKMDESNLEKDGYHQSLPYFISELLFDSDYHYPAESAPIAVLGTEGYGQKIHSASDLTHFFASFSDIVFTEENNAELQQYFGSASVSGDEFHITPGTPERETKVQILSAEYTEEEMQIHFTEESSYAEYYNEVSGEFEYNVTKNYNKIAVLKPSGNGKYEIKAIMLDEGQSLAVDAADPAEAETGSGTETSGDETEFEEDDFEEDLFEEDDAFDSVSAVADDVEELYNQVLDHIENREPGYELLDDETRAMSTTEDLLEYFIHDMTGDGIPELFVGETYTVDVFIAHATRIYTVNLTEEGYVLSSISGGSKDTTPGEIFYLFSVILPADGNGIYENIVFSRGTGKCGVMRDVIRDGVFRVWDEQVLSYQLGDDISSYFSDDISAQWYPISDRSFLVQ